MKRQMKGLLFFVLLLAVSLIVVACGDNDGMKNNNASEETNNSANATESNGADVDKLVVGTDATYAPMELIDDDGEIVGIDIDIVDAIGEAMGIEMEYKNIGWEPLFPAVDSGEVDFAVSSITITEEREESFDFTDPYYVANQLILVPEDSDVSSMEDLDGKRISVQINTTGHIVTREHFGSEKNIVAAETMPLAISDMLNGNADASIGDNSTVNEYIQNNPNAKVKTVEDDSFDKEYYGLMVKKDNQETLDILNEGIAKIKESGKLEEITGISDLD